MCLIVFDWRPGAAGAGALLSLAGNRDEFFSRESLPLGWWADAPAVLAGRDVSGAGTWLGLTRDGRFAALTNVRAPRGVDCPAGLPAETAKASPASQPPSRGQLVSGFLTGARRAPLAYLQEVGRRGAEFNGFNLLVGDFVSRELAWYSNRGAAAPSLLPPGLYGLSNASLDTPWPKVVWKKAALQEALTALAIESPEPAAQAGTAPMQNVPRELAALLELMRDPRRAVDAELPATGVTHERERALSAAFIETPDYGTRSTTALRVRADGTLAIAERSDDDGTHQLERPGSFMRSFALAWPAGRGAN